MKQLALFVFVAAISMAFVACGGDSDDAATPGGGLRRGDDRDRAGGRGERGRGGGRRD